MKIAICEDDLFYRQYVVDLLKSKLNVQNLAIICYSDGQKLINDFANHSSVDIVFLDLEMPVMNGQKAAQLIRQIDRHVIIIFLTSHADYARHAFELNVHRYILKSEIKEKIDEAINSACFQLDKRKSNFHFETEDGIHRKIEKKQIIYVEYVRRRIIMHTHDNNYRLKSSVPFYEIEASLLGSVFVRCYKGLVVNVENIVSISKKQVVLSDGSVLPVSRQYENDVFRIFKKFLEGSH